ncbi:MAG TPA: DEAD/DEAH box helicase [Spirochaetota bacterium]|nr:DEAD/DEAH box helicase [Spirochaetota bacterium]HPJ35471.1 DEAD/DEAH box helicase [Spirochaetota bacterium]
MNTDTDLMLPDLFACCPDEEVLDGELRILNEARIMELISSEPLPHGRRFILRTESFILKLAYAYNKILSLSNSRTRILAHQVESTHRIVNSFRQRFLIADEVGLGKTVEAGLVIKEMIYRQNYKRIIIICPASLLFQWQNEMESKFNEKFAIMDRKLLKKASRIAGEGGNPWKVYDRIICSLDFIKGRDFQEDLKNCSWDFVIFDEAHRLRRDTNSSTMAFNMAEQIATKTKSLLLLSATPFRGKLEELYYLIGLIDKNILGPYQSFYNQFCIEGADLSELKRKLDQVVIRRTKNEVGGFTKRHARTIRFDLYDDEWFLYEETTKYVAEEFNRALQSENRAVGFVMTVFQKLLDSSSHALLVALRNRSARLKDLLARAESCNDAYVIFNNGIFDNETAADNDELTETDELTVQKTIDELKIEIATIDRLVGIAAAIEVNKKGEKVIKLIKDLKKKGHAKFLIFTQFRTTQDYLMEILEGYSRVAFNGSMNRDEKEEAILSFKNDVEIIIATEAGGEGRNMQFCDVLINYDLPWSPLKIEQRIGRIHRFGQPNDVHIYNFSTRGTVAERVLQVLSEKLKIFEESIGTPDIMLGQIEDEINLNTLFMELASGRKKKKDVESEISARMENARQSFEKLTELTVAGRMDFNYDEYYKVTLKDRTFTNRRIEKFIDDFIDEDSFADGLISRKNRRTGLYRVSTGEEGDSHVKYGTFDSERALEDESLEFLAFGHTSIDRIINYCNSDEFGGETGVVFMKSDVPFEGMIFNYLVEFSSVSVTHQFFPVLIEAGSALSGYEKDSIEEQFQDQDFIHSISPSDYSETVCRIKENAGSYFNAAREKIIDRINDRLFDMNENLDIQIDPEIEKIRESYSRQIKELEEKLDLHESQMKWYGKDMKGVITRIRNRILKARTEMESLLKEHRDYCGIKYKVTLINASVVIAESEF